MDLDDSSSLHMTALQWNLAKKIQGPGGVNHTKYVFVTHHSLSRKVDLRATGTGHRRHLADTQMLRRRTGSWMVTSWRRSFRIHNRRKSWKAMLKRSASTCPLIMSRTYSSRCRACTELKSPDACTQTLLVSIAVTIPCTVLYYAKCTRHDETALHSKGGYIAYK